MVQSHIYDSLKEWRGPKSHLVYISNLLLFGPPWKHISNPFVMILLKQLWIMIDRLSGEVQEPESGLKCSYFSLLSWSQKLLIRWKMFAIAMFIFDFWSNIWQICLPWTVKKTARGKFNHRWQIIASATWPNKLLSTRSSIILSSSTDTVAKSRK